MQTVENTSIDQEDNSFERHLEELMALRNISCRAEAITLAVKECLDQAKRENHKVKFNNWLSMRSRGEI